MTASFRSLQLFRMGRFSALNSLKSRLTDLDGPAMSAMGQKRTFCTAAEIVIRSPRRRASVRCQEATSTSPRKQPLNAGQLCRPNVMRSAVRSGGHQSSSAGLIAGRALMRSNQSVTRGRVCSHIGAMSSMSSRLAWGVIAMSASEKLSPANQAVWRAPSPFCRDSWEVADFAKLMVRVHYCRNLVIAL